MAHPLSPAPFQTALRISLFFALLFTAETVMAGGFELPGVGTKAVGRGGAYAVGVRDLTALHHNPANLALIDGSFFQWDHNLSLSNVTFARSPLAQGWGDDGGHSFDPVSDKAGLFPLGVFVGSASDFGLEDWMFALAVYGPNGTGSREFDAYGPQSFMLTRMETLMAFYTAAVAWRPSENFSVGFTLQYVDLPKLQYGLVVDATSSNQIHPVPDKESTHVEATLDLQDHFAFTAQLGLWWRPIDCLEIGLSGRVIPVELNPTGSVILDKEGLTEEGVTAQQNMTLPVNIRGGIRYIYRSEEVDWFDVELNAVWENWSVVDAMRVTFEGKINAEDVQDIALDRQWSDTVSLRLGSDITVIPDSLTLRLGGFVENGATPDNYAHIDFPTFDRLGLSGGLTVQFDAITISAGYLHVFQETMETSEAFGKVFQRRPLSPCEGSLDNCGGISGVVANAGTITSSYDIFSVGMKLHFSDWF